MNDFDEADLVGILIYLLGQDVLEDAALGITKLAVSKGINNLSAEEEFVLDEHVIKVYIPSICQRCEDDLLWSERSEAIENGGLCSYCYHMWSRIESE